MMKATPVAVSEQFSPRSRCERRYTSFSSSSSFVKMWARPAFPLLQQAELQHRPHPVFTIQLSRWKGTYVCFLLALTTTPFCDTRLCAVMNVQRCIPQVEICDGEKFCDDGTDEIGKLFPNVARCHPSTGRVESPVMSVFEFRGSSAR